MHANDAGIDFRTHINAIGVVTTSDDTTIYVSHTTVVDQVSGFNTGFVDISTGSTESSHHIVLNPEDALLLANRITRAANLALQAVEDALPSSRP